MSLQRSLYQVHKSPKSRYYSEISFVITVTKKMNSILGGD